MSSIFLNSASFSTRSAHISYNEHSYPSKLTLMQFTLFTITALLSLTSTDTVCSGSLSTPQCCETDVLGNVTDECENPGLF
jgi:hypothetical protein